MCLICAQQQKVLSHFKVHQKFYLLIYISSPQHLSSLKYNRSKIGQVQFPPNDHLRSENHIQTNSFEAGAEIKGYIPPFSRFFASNLKKKKRFF